MSTNDGVTQDQLLNATTPEALQALHEAAEQGGTQQGVTAPAPAPAAANPADAGTAAPAPAPAAASATPGADSEEVQGIATKSGKGVLPFRVLADERQQKQHWRGQAETLAQQLEAAERKVEELQAAGGTKQQQEQLLDKLGISDDEIAAAEADWPLLAKVAKGLKAQAAAPAPTPAPPPPSAADQQDAADERVASVNAAMAGLPILQNAHAKGGVLWNRAIELDAAVRDDPSLQFNTLAERFAEVQKRLAAELGVQVAAPPPGPVPPPAAPAQAPAAQPFRPNTSSDLHGGASPDGGDGISEKANGMAMARRFATMTDEQIQEAVRKSAS